ncbi:ABC transporter ATP-binding protein [Coraliomargarita sp. SDUM461004]|uniref:ABC transporter ATP-binding protein n=1 Tax=Thalassobacterium sedimentorum TaxID=3041258 RepID=A0ABU1AJL3_9BACT|nr:ABC transporter ATP-binding protein [Coraliomargarita sp. SDUM461004]MDQ8195002.1 ABC transporter ATP-binding protein [Coraliomargarita sp. SDUM461004]
MKSKAQLIAQELSIGYYQGSEATTVAASLNCSLRGGEFVCLLGPNGAGKSTLIRTLAGMQAPLAGDLNLSGIALKNISPRERARAVSVVLTETLATGMMDVYSMVSLGRHPYSGWFGGLSQRDHERIKWALTAVGALPLAQRQVAELSDGERQKVSIARALAQEAKLMLLDEPTAFLDLPRRVELMSILRNLAQRENLALLLSTHDLDLALRFADRLWLMTPAGELIQGAPEALALNGQFAQVFANDNLDWDAGSGSFRTHPIACLNVWLEGEGLIRTWTQRALERLGFGIAKERTEAVFSLRVHPQCWEVTFQDEMQTFSDIELLIEWICTQDWLESKPALCG